MSFILARLELCRITSSLSETWKTEKFKTIVMKHKKSQEKLVHHPKIPLKHAQMRKC